MLEYIVSLYYKMLTFFSKRESINENVNDEKVINETDCPMHLYQEDKD